MALYLLLWGEAGNLRFMPELLCFLFETANAHVRQLDSRRGARDDAHGARDDAHDASPAAVATGVERVDVASNGMSAEEEIGEEPSRCGTDAEDAEGAAAAAAGSPPHAPPNAINGNQRQSRAIEGSPPHAPPNAINGNQRQSRAIKGSPPHAPPNAYLHRIVRPVYDCVFRETFLGLVKGRPMSKPAKDMPRFPRNYDDWNEAFWSLESLSTLRSKRGVPLMSLPPPARWEALLEDTDWPAFFAATRKTHRELRWWYCLVAANRRVFLLHALSFGVLAIAAYPADDGSEVRDD